MLQTAISVADCGDEKDVAGHRRRLTKEANLPFADAFEVGGQTLHVAIVLPGDRYLVRDSTRNKTRESKATHLDRMVDQFVVTGGTVKAITMPLRAMLLAVRRFQCRGYAPILEGLACRWLDVDQAGEFFLPKNAQEYAGAVKKGMGLVEVRAANRKVPRIDLTGDGNRLAMLQPCSLPGVFVQFCQAYRPATRHGADGDNVPRKVAYQVAAGNPGREGEALAGRVGRRDGATPLESVCMHAQGTNGISDRRVVHSQMCRDDDWRIVLSILSEQVSSKQPSLLC